jgi:hypothetical protein
MASMAAGNALQELAEQHPTMDAIRYDWKNVKWTFEHVDYFSDALATGIVEAGIAPGDVVLSWLPQHFSEQLIIQFACSKAGLILYSLDPAQAIADPEGAKASLARALEVTQANILFTQEAGDDTNYFRLCTELMPEIRIFNFGDGMPFISPRFPHLRFPIHTGFDCMNKHGMVHLKQMLVPSGELSNLLEGFVPTGSTPLMGELVQGKDGLPTKGKILTNDEVIKTNAWPTFNAVLKKEYLDIPGVGVIF